MAYIDEGQPRGGWYPDPSDPEFLRKWDERGWTEQRLPASRARRASHLAAGTGTNATRDFIEQLNASAPARRPLAGAASPALDLPSTVGQRPAAPALDLPRPVGPRAASPALDLPSTVGQRPASPALDLPSTVGPRAASPALDLPGPVRHVEDLRVREPERPAMAAEVAPDSELRAQQRRAPLDGGVTSRLVELESEIGTRRAELTRELQATRSEHERAEAARRAALEAEETQRRGALQREETELFAALAQAESAAHEAAQKARADLDAELIRLRAQGASDIEVLRTRANEEILALRSRAEEEVAARLADLEGEETRRRAALDAADQEAERRRAAADAELEQRRTALGTESVDRRAALDRAEAELARIRSDLEAEVRHRIGELEAREAEAAREAERHRSEIERLLAEEEESRRRTAAQEFRLAETAAEATRVADAVMGRQRELAGVQAEIAAARAALLDLGERVKVQDTGLYNYFHPAEASAALSDQLDELRRAVVNTLRGSGAISMKGVNPKNRQPAAEAAELAVRVYNAEAENAIRTAAAGSVDAALFRLMRARDAIATHGGHFGIAVSEQYHDLRMEEIKLLADLRHRNREEEAAVGRAQAASRATQDRPVQPAAGTAGQPFSWLISQGGDRAPKEPR